MNYFLLSPSHWGRWWGRCLTRLVFSLFQGVWGAVMGSLSNSACVLPVSGGVGGSGGVAV